jgi:hypothetical protein
LLFAVNSYIKIEWPNVLYEEGNCGILKNISQLCSFTALIITQKLNTFTIGKRFTHPDYTEKKVDGKLRQPDHM